MSKSLYTLKHEQLLRDLKSTIDGLLSIQTANIWSIYGGLNRLHNLLDKIFKHGCKSSETNGSYLEFVQGLEWLQPDSSKRYFSTDFECQPHIPAHVRDVKASIWLYKSLENLSLSSKLSWLLSDRNHLNTCYFPFAYLCNEEYAEATLICLKALERNQPSLMSEINPCLFVQQPTAENIHKIHRRCSSFPDKYLVKNNGETRIIRRSSDISEKPRIFSKMKPWHSTPNLYLDKMEIVKEMMQQSRTVPNTPIHLKKKIEGECSNSNKPTLKKVVLEEEIIEHTTPISSSIDSEKSSRLTKREISVLSSPRSVVDFFSAIPGQKDYKKVPKKSFIEDGGKTVLPMSTGYFPRPAKGQSLMSFLTSSQFSRTNAELDRENAHFSVSEAIISAMEQIRCKQDVRLCDDDQLDESDPEINDLKQRIRIRRRQKMAEKHKRLLATSALSDSTTTASPPSTPDMYTDTSSSDNIEDVEIEEASNILDNKGLSISMASLYSETDFEKFRRGAPDGASDIFSAESVAISLISKFKEKQLPKASELEWLVSEKEAPQALLPIPNSVPVSPDDFEGSSIHLRGTSDWAPPRPQIIFTLHPPTSRKQMMIKQNHRCAGCSMQVAPKYASKFRYCEYLGRYFCTGCHSNQLSVIPARIIQKWDFKRYSVSTFSYRLLEQMFNDPLFHIFELNRNVGKLSKDLEFCRKYSKGLYFIKDFIFACKNTESFRDELKPFVKNSIEELEVYSLNDLVEIKSGKMKSKLKFVVDTAIHHIIQCQICMGRGHICEICKTDEILFPWQMYLVFRCDKCGTCYHKRCIKNDTFCVKCKRLNKRRDTSSTS